MSYSSIDYVKEIALKIGWNGEKDSKGRYFLSELKRILIEYDDIPFKKTCEKIEEFLNSDYEILFICVREAEEIEKIVKKYNAETIIVSREILEELSNDSDRYVESYSPYTYCLNNNTTLEKLNNIAKSFVEYIRKENEDV